jgi:hypothetical protein
MLLDASRVRLPPIDSVRELPPLITAVTREERTSTWTESEATGGTASSRAKRRSLTNNLMTYVDPTDRVFPDNMNFRGSKDADLTLSCGMGTSFMSDTDH